MARCSRDRLRIYSTVAPHQLQTTCSSYSTVAPHQLQTTSNDNYIIFKAIILGCLRPDSLVPLPQDVFGMKASRFWRLEGGLDDWFAWAAAWPTPA